MADAVLTKDNKMINGLISNSAVRISLSPGQAHLHSILLRVFILCQSALQEKGHPRQHEHGRGNLLSQGLN